ncbi:glucan endo-1,3-beta-glucosidase 13 [Gastrolobium bilobum]|uniref:glucan endo-1,3-beta-glucosidase 13 n=1 Tax=Gastrolobium bilobum TaxID=150636 RepID=UPI002AAFCCFB|nr:glucan endo-1,3-beta-glucosidase 13 [Gastrolobium bilobum]
MLKMACLFQLIFLCSLGLTVAGQESIELLHLCETTHDIFEASSHGDLPLAVSVSAIDLNGVSSSILFAERWLRSNVLEHYPAAKITTIVVGSAAFCQKDQQQNLLMVLSSLKNVHHSLRRWGLEKDIKVSVSFHLDCLSLSSASYNDDLKMVKPMIEFLQSVNSTYSIIPPHSGFSHFSDKSLSLVSSHLDSMKKFGFFHLNNINVVAIVPKGRKTITRKLSVVDSSLIGPFPVRPTPMPEIAEPPLDFSVGYPAPANVAKKPLPPLAQVVSSPPPMSSPTFAPEEPPFVVPASSPHGFTLPPCNPIYNGSPYPQIIPVQKLWCVAKPTVPEETLQQALDYACGEGGADCMDITPQGNCYDPDTVIAHASYAFNSYWQKHKRNGGTCSFGGTAMLINTDPSFLHCRFILS